MAEVVLALDVGEARIGVARGELGSSFAFGRGFIERRDPESDLAEIVRLFRSEGAECVVVGLPRRTDGGESEQTRRVRQFAAGLEAAGLRVELEDERFTTHLAAQRLRGSGLGRQRRQEKGRLDEASAVLILESYLQRKREAGQ